MDNKTAIEFNSLTCETIERELTEKEIEENVNLEIKHQEKISLESKKYEILKKLGLNEEEAAALLA